MAWIIGVCMKNFLSRVKRSDGFTLVELMVVVAIIGLLSAVAIPNFKKYQAKAKVSEAKLQLSAMYTAETSFYSDYNIYHNCLVYMGFDPARETPSRYFTVGFGVDPGALNPTAHTAAVNAGLAIAECPLDPGLVQGATSGNSTATATWFPAGKGVGSTIGSAVGFLPTTSLGDQSSAANMTFVVGAGGVISQDHLTTTNAAALTINQLKVISVIRNGF